MRTIPIISPIVMFFVHLFLAHLEPLKQMWADAETQGQKVVAGVMITWIAGLMILFWVGWTTLVYGILSGEAISKMQPLVFLIAAKYEKV